MNKKMKKVAVVSLSPWEEFWKECDEKGSLKTRNAGKGGGEVSRTACTEIAGDDTVIPDEAWARDGEFDEAEPNNGMDTGIFKNDPHDPEVHHQDLENLDEEDIYSDRDGSEEELSQEEREVERLEPQNMLKAAKNLLHILYGVTDESVSMEEFEAMNPIITLYLRERMDGIVRHFLNNLRDEHITETVLDFTKKMVPYKPAVSEEEVGHILPHARIEKFESEATIRRIKNNSEISVKTKQRLVNQAQWEESRYNNGNHLAIQLGVAIFGKEKFRRLLNVTV